ncbi:MAG TPA: hypothetical protein VMI56_22925 [Reyranella sp.]|nr:hypothetical protein [Reyranella sp.]
MLTMRPQKAFVFSLVAVERAYDILDNGEPVAVATYLKNKGGSIAVDGRRYIVQRGGGPSAEMLGQVLIRLATGRKRAFAAWTLIDPEGKTVISARQSADGVAVSRGGETFAFRKSRKSGYQLFRAGGDRPLGSTKGLDLPAEFDVLFQAFLFALAIALSEEDPGGVDAYVPTT